MERLWAAAPVPSPGLRESCSGPGLPRGGGDEPGDGGREGGVTPGGGSGDPRASGRAVRAAVRCALRKSTKPYVDLVRCQISKRMLRGKNKQLKGGSARSRVWGEESLREMK